MATVEEILAKAAKAEAAGDFDAARALVGIVKQAMGGANKQEQPLGPAAPPVAGSYESTGPAPDRFGDTVANVTAGPIAATKAFAGGLVSPETSPSRRFLKSDPYTGKLPNVVNNALGYVGDAGMTALSALGTGLSAGAGLVGEALGGSPTNERKLARDLIGMATVAAPELAGVSPATLAARSTARKVAALERVDRAPTQSQAAAQAASDLGVTPSLAMQGKNRAMLSAALEKVPLSGGVIAKDAARAAGEIEGAFRGAVGKIGNAAGPLAAGERLQGGVRTYQKAFEAQSGRMYDKVEKLIPPATPAKIDNAAAAVSGFKENFAANPKLAAKLGLNEWDAVIAEAQTNGISFKALRQLRSDIGRAISSNRGALKDEDLGRLNRLYGALSDDMGAAAAAAGPDALAAWKKANSFYKSGATRIDKYLDKTVSAENPERAFEAFSAMAKADRSTSDIKRMREIKAAIPAEDWADVSASLVDRLGKAKAGAQNATGDAFSPATFLTNWNTLSPEAKALLAGGEARVQLDKLATVAEAAKRGGLERNMSNTGTVGMAGLLGAGAITDLGTTAAAVGGAAGLAKLMTTPRFLKMMNQAARGDMRTVNALARGDSTIAREAKLIASMVAAGQQPANESSAPLRAATR